MATAIASSSATAPHELGLAKGKRKNLVALPDAIYQSLRDGFGYTGRNAEETLDEKGKVVEYVVLTSSHAVPGSWNQGDNVVAGKPGFDTKLHAVAQGQRQDGKSEEEVTQEVGDALQYALTEQDSDDDSEDVKDMLDKGLKAAIKLPAKRVDAIAPEVAKLSEATGVAFQGIWRLGCSTDVLSTLVQTNNSIEAYNKAHGISAFDNVVPLTEMLSRIPIIRRRAFDWYKEKSTKQGSTSQKAADGALELTQFLTSLASCGMSWRSCLNADQTRILNEMVKDAKPTFDPDLWQRLADYISQDTVLPSAQQNAIVAAHVRSFLSGFDSAAEGRTQDTENLLTQLQKVNKQLKACNKASNEISTNHLLPTELIHEAFHSPDFVQAAADQRRRRALEIRLHFAAWLTRQGYSGISSLLPVGSDIESVEFNATWKDTFNKHLRSSRSLVEVPEASIIAADEHAGPSTTTPSRYDLARSAEEVLVDKRDAQTEWRKQHPTAEPVDVEPESLFLPEHAGLLSNEVPGPLYEDGITTFGKVVAVQKLFRGYRSIANVGTINVPVYKFFSGNTLGRGVLEAIADQFPSEPSTKLKSFKATDVKKLLAIVELDSKDGKSSLRAPITKFQVHWQDNSIEWVSRSDLISACGKGWVEGQRRGMLATWRHNLAHLEKAKARRINPETMQPLEEQLRASMPWLFKDAVVLGMPDPQRHRAAGMPGTNAIEVETARFGDAKMQDADAVEQQGPAKSRRTNARGKEKAPVRDSVETMNSEY